MEIEILNAADFKTSQWAGGTTTQLYLYPKNASYQERNFDFRISTAKVEINESTFTSLPNVARKLMILEGAITIQHENQYTKQLQKFEMDTFLGDWKTTAQGTCTDFNVMTTNHIASELNSLQLNAHQSFNLKLDSNYTWFFCYVFKGKLDIEIAQRSYEIAQGGLLVLKNNDASPLHILTSEACELVLTRLA